MIPVCPNCGSDEHLRGAPADASVEMVCDACGHSWIRALEKQCPSCGGTDVQTVPLAIVEKGRGTQLSVVGTRPIDLCSECDRARLREYHDRRPNPLMPAQLPTVGAQD
jgi:hypothetical protein